MNIGVIGHTMTRIVASLSVLFCLGRAQAQAPETWVLHQAVSNRDTITYTRVIRFDDRAHLFHVQDYFESGQIQMDAFYSSFDKRVKEEYQCDYRSNTKEGAYREWYRNGRLRFEGRFTRGRLGGASTAWYESGQKEAEEHWLDGQLHGRVKYWSERGALQFASTFRHGMNQRRRSVSYRYVSYLPKGYAADTARKWPLVIYLHGGSDRGTDLKKLYSSGIPDQVYRGREFPFIMLAPQGPEHLRWSTDDWFENFYKEATFRYRIDADRVYLTGPSLGGSGTWYIAARYPEVFAAIAPMSGFTSNINFIDENIDRLIDMPVWVFHGKLDTVVPFEETERIVKRLEGRNGNLRFSAGPDLGHEIHWQVYPGRDLYEWFLRHDRSAPSRPDPGRPVTASARALHIAHQQANPNYAAGGPAMSIGQDFLREFDEEMASTRKALERVPSDKGHWKPHPKSFSFGHLAQLVSWMPGWISETLREPFKDLGRPGSGYSYETTESLLKGFDANVAAARDALQTAAESAWSETWQLRRGEQVFWSAPRTVVVRTHLNHLIHHRAQLGVYLRLNDIPVPPAYGPTADENPFQP